MVVPSSRPTRTSPWPAKSASISISRLGHAAANSRTCTVTPCRAVASAWFRASSVVASSMYCSPQLAQICARRGARGWSAGRAPGSKWRCRVGSRRSCRGGISQLASPSAAWTVTTMRNAALDYKPGCSEKRTATSLSLPGGSRGPAEVSSPARAACVSVSRPWARARPLPLPPVAAHRLPLLEVLSPPVANGTRDHPPAGPHAPISRTLAPERVLRDPDPSNFPLEIAR